MTSKQAFLKTSIYHLCTRSQFKGGVTYVRTYVRARACVYYVQSTYLVGGGLIVEANIPVQELEGQRGEGAYFREDTVLVLSLHVNHSITHTRYMHAHKRTHTHSHEQCEYCRVHFGCQLNDETNKMNWCVDNCNPSFTAPKRLTNISISNGDFAELRANHLLHSFGQIFYSQFIGKNHKNNVWPL